MEFGSPWMLLGLLLAAIPLALHLFGRRRAPVVHFSALAFIMANNPKEARALQITEWLLVALRALAVALVAIALSRPMLPVPEELGEASIGAANGPLALVVVLDDSMSMGASGERDTLYEQARHQAQKLIERLPVGSQVGLVASGAPARALTRHLTDDRGTVLDALRRLQHQPRRDDAGRAMALAEGLLAATELTDRRVLLLSDLQASGWQGVRLQAVPTGNNPTPERPPLRLQVQQLKATETANTAIVDATALPVEGKAGSQVRVEVAVRRFARQPQQDYVTVRVGDREVKSQLQLAAGAEARRSFLLPTSAPVAEILLPDDALATDNRRLLRIDTSSALRVALVNGAPRPLPRDDEVFFAARALELAAAFPGEMAVDILPADKVTAAQLADFDVLVLANLGEVGPELQTALVDAVTAGKGLLIAPGDNLPGEPKEWLQGLVPARVVGVRESVAARRADADTEAGGRTEPAKQSGAEFRLSAAMEPSPVAAINRLRAALQASVGASLDGTRVDRSVLVEPTPEAAERTVLRLSDGAPALLAGQVGRGTVALLTTTLDRDWSDLPLQPGFLPLMHTLVLQLAGERGLERRAAIEVGDPLVLGRDDRADQLEVRADGADGRGAGLRKVVAAADQRGRSWHVLGVEAPGRYTATELRGGEPLTSRTVIVAPPKAESDLTPLQDGPLVSAVKGGVGAANSASNQLSRAPGWTPSLLLLLLLLLLEGIVLVRGSRSGSVDVPGRLAAGLAKRPATARR
jgi:hypothetical protein